jgi:hypothetical protein
VAKRESFLLRIDPEILSALRHWSDDELRSVNAQIEFLLRKSLKEASRLPKEEPATKKHPPSRDAPECGD